ncbi:hypothetical protein ACTWQB_17145 [Piscibacillus sp. B03]
MSNFTPTGFKKPFACCAHYHICDMGSQPCVYKEKDPITMENCIAYKRNNSRTKKQPKVDHHDVPENGIITQDADGQLSLFSLNNEEE